jgi:Spy/CpxP family protein refolding chaperone
MRQTTRGIALSLFLAMCWGQPDAQEPGTRLEEYQQRLNLTPSQIEQIRPILEDEAAKLREIRSKHQGDTSRRGRRSLLRELRAVQQDAQTRIDPLLTPQQRAEWTKLRAERRDELRQMRK